ncbi:MAG: diguanylate cyclase [Nitrospirota bacterium]
MRVLHRLTTMYIMGLGFLAFIVLMAFLSFNHIYISMEKIMTATEAEVLKHEDIPIPNAYDLKSSLAEIKSIRKKAYIFFTAALLLSSSGILFIIHIYRKNIVTPLHKITAATQKMAQGEFERLALDSSSDIGTLAKNFNLMGQSLRDKISELEEAVRSEQDVVRTLNILNELNSSIIFKWNVDEVLKTIILFSTSIIKSEIGAIVVMNKLSRQVSHFVTSLHKDQGDITDIASKIARAIIDSGTPIRLRLPSEDKRFKDLLAKSDLPDLADSSDKSDIAINNCLAVPLMIEGETLGAFILFNKLGADEFTMKDEDLALTVSFQGAMAIEKSLFHEEIVQLAKTDGLTGLNNHRTFHEDLEEEIKRARRFNRYLTLLLIDIDYFKKFNDAYGHQGGDAALKQLAGIIRQNSRSIDSAARYGGEEFTIILSETNLEGGIKTAERIINEINTRSFDVIGMEAHLAVSIGISIFPDDAINKEGLIKAADEALYLAKRTGGNRAVTFQQYKAEAMK